MSDEILLTDIPEPSLRLNKRRNRTTYSSPVRKQQTRRARSVSPRPKQTRRKWYNTLWDLLPFKKTASVAPIPRTPRQVPHRPNLSAHRRREARKRKNTRKNTRRNTRRTLTSI
jgi:hypothetical protein